MNVSVKSLGIDKLPVEEKVALIGEIWDGISADAATLPLSEEFKMELDRRITDADANPDESIPWEEVRASAEARLDK